RPATSPRFVHPLELVLAQATPAELTSTEYQPRLRSARSKTAAPAATAAATSRVVRRSIPPPSVVKTALKGRTTGLGAASGLPPSSTAEKWHESKRAAQVGVGAGRSLGGGCGWKRLEAGR